MGRGGTPSHLGIFHMKREMSHLRRDELETFQMRASQMKMRATTPWIVGS